MHGPMMNRMANEQIGIECDRSLIEKALTLLYFYMIIIIIGHCHSIWEEFIDLYQFPWHPNHSESNKAPFLCVLIS